MVTAREDLGASGFLGPQYCSVLSIGRMDSLSMTVTMRDNEKGVLKKLEERTTVRGEAKAMEWGYLGTSGKVSEQL